ncbi:hypothetical protein BZB76_2749 [Actinomadura pelletieri DSM 43383]|uniref:Uncharacterized protein n=1 Tax=Actinomadura pelletieri DSM 43383 TaxID=1120940 RepID=A0A495QMN6_9ACTN|nr:hypothetical protein [Actinomadura pelletieri]RKS74240.1 hypothetical protein BZB76_2749 [Actinomadura pelletieri DSM 43383]
MYRFLTQPVSVAMFSDLLRYTTGVLGCTALAGFISISAATPVEAVASAAPEPHRSLPPVCRRAQISGDRHATYKCKEAWLAMYERSRRRSGRGREFSRRSDRFEWKFKVRRDPQTPKRVDEPRPRPTVVDAPKVTSPSPSRPRSSPPRVSPAPQPTLTPRQAQNLDSRPFLLEPLLLFGLLLPAAAAICYSFRRRLCAAVGLSAISAAMTASPQPALLTFRSELDPFAAPATGLTGPGAIASARALALTALDEYGHSSLVVIPRPDAIALFGLGEDELLDDDTAGLFIPGNLDAALAYLETELVIRQNTGVTQGRRLLLVADCATEGDRIHKLLGRHPGAVCAILLGSWTGDQATVDEEGLVDAPPALAATLPNRLPAISRVEARERLLSALARQQQDREPPSKRRSTPRRP